MVNKFLSALHVYPVKALKGLSYQTVQVGQKGPELDRRWMVVDETGRFVSQRQHAKMALIEVQPKTNGIVLKTPDFPDLCVPLRKEGKHIHVQIWNDTCTAIDQGQEAAAWLSQFLGNSSKLVFMPDASVRKINPLFAISNEDQVGFADAFAFLLISTASLEDLNSRLKQPVPMNRFRPNLIIENCEPYEEDRWKTIRIGHMIFDVVKPCSRCVVTTTNQDTAEREVEHLQTLATYRKQEKGIMFGQNLVHRMAGTLQVGDLLEVLEWK